MTAVAFGPDADRRSAADRAHRGYVEGALGAISRADTGPRRGAARRLATLAAVLGPGLVVMTADNDAGGVSTYAQAGQDYGLRIGWILVLLIPVLFVIQEMASRLGAVTGAGHARLITERFGRRWGAFALADLLALNLLLLVTEFVGVSMSLGYFGVSKFVSVPAAAAFLVAATATGSFRRWERLMYVLVLAGLAAVPLLAFSHAAHAAAAPVTVAGDGRSGGLFFAVALVGATVAPWQLFFHQSNVIDKRITARFLGYERVDTALGAVLFGVGALAVLFACAFALGATSRHGAFTDAGTVARGLRAEAGAVPAALFAVVLLAGSVLGASAVTLATSYAVGDYFGFRHSLHRNWRRAKNFHRTYAVSVAVAAAVVLVPRVPLGLLTTAVQALAGILLPIAAVFLLLLCNDSEVLGPRVNSRWLNALAAAVVGVLLILSALLTVRTAFPRVPLEPVVIGLGALLAVLLLSGGAGLFRSSPPRLHRWRAPGGARARRPARTGDAGIWTMPPIESLAPPPSSRGRTVGLVVLRCYLFLAAALLIARTIQLMLGAS